MKVMMWGSCVAGTITRLSRIDAIITERRIYSDVMPWNFYEPPISNTYNTKIPSLYARLEGFEKALREVDWMFVDLFTFSKYLVNVEGFRTIALNPNVQNWLRHNKQYKQEWSVEFEEEYILSSLEKIADFIKSNFDTRKIIIIKPVLSTKYLDSQYRINTLDEEAVVYYKKIQDMVWKYSDFLAQCLGDGVQVYEIPDTVISDTADKNHLLRVHYLWQDYYNIEEDILKLMNIDYKQYWSYELNPVELALAKCHNTIRRYHKVVEEIEKEVCEVHDQGYYISTMPTKLSTEKFFLNSALETRIQYRNVNNLPICLWGGGVRCLEYFEKCKIPVALILDNNKEKLGSKMHDIEIKHPTEVEDLKKYFIIITADKSKEIEEQLMSYGLVKGKNYILQYN